jgi:hypothetical protein
MNPVAGVQWITLASGKSQKINEQKLDMVIQEDWDCVGHAQNLQKQDFEKEIRWNFSQSLHIYWTVWNRQWGQWQIEVTLLTTTMLTL